MDKNDVYRLAYRKAYEAVRQLTKDATGDPIAFAFYFDALSAMTNAALEAAREVGVEVVDLLEVCDVDVDLPDVDVDDDGGMPWCPACQSYHHPDNPSCMAAKGGAS